MNINVIDSDGRQIVLRASAGQSIYQLLKMNGIPLDAPCGGNGSCHKCNVTADGRTRLACATEVREGMTVELPRLQGVRILGAGEELFSQMRYQLRISNPFHEGRGLVIDLGTTTVALLVCSLRNGHILAEASGENLQKAFGADVISRIIEQGKEGGLQRLKEAALKSIRDILPEECESIRRVTIAGNTTMEYLLLGLPAECIRKNEPEILEFPNREVQGLPPVKDGTELLLSPNVGSYVGGDITAGVFASGLWKNETMSLFIDLGTNGEVVFGNNEFMLCCACSAGPAFEGGDTSCGMRAMDGAIDSVTINEEDFEPSFTVIGDPESDDSGPEGLCGSGIIDLVAELFRCRMITPRGKFCARHPRITEDEFGVKRYSLTHRIYITETDLDNIIRAKGAIYAGIIMMLKSLDLELPVLQDIYIAGGIGAAINMKNAMAIGMLPCLPEENFHYLGNASLLGAYAMTVSEDAEKKIHELSGSMTYLDLSTAAGYMDVFTSECFLPHTSEF